MKEEFYKFIKANGGHAYSKFILDIINKYSLDEVLSMLEDLFKYSVDIFWVTQNKYIKDPKYISSIKKILKENLKTIHFCAPLSCFPLDQEWLEIYSQCQEIACGSMVEMILDSDKVEFFDYFLNNYKDLCTRNASNIIFLAKAKNKSSWIDKNIDFFIPVCYDFFPLVVNFNLSNESIKKIREYIAANWDSSLSSNMHLWLNYYLCLSDEYKDTKDKILENIKNNWNEIIFYMHMFHGKNDYYVIYSLCQNDETLMDVFISMMPKNMARVVCVDPFYYCTLFSKIPALKDAYSLAVKNKFGDIIRDCLKIGRSYPDKLISTICMIFDEVVNYEKVSYADIDFSDIGSTNKVFFVGDKVIKLALERKDSHIPNNPFIVKPLIRRYLTVEGKSIYIEIIERVETFNNIVNREAISRDEVSVDEVYDLYKKIRDAGLYWSDVCANNVGRLLKDNTIHWKQKLEPSDDVLAFSSSIQGDELKAGDLVVLDSEYFYPVSETSNVPSFGYTKSYYEKRYQEEKQKNGQK